MDFGRPSQAIFTLSDGNVLTLTGTAVGDKRWIEVQADEGRRARREGRRIARSRSASYRYDAIFRPLEQLLVPKETEAAGTSPRRSRGPQGAAPRRRKPMPRPGAP